MRPSDVYSYTMRYGACLTNKFSLGAGSGHLWQNRQPWRAQRSGDGTLKEPDASPRLCRLPAAAGKNRSVGVFHRTAKGFGFVRPETLSPLHLEVVDDSHAHDSGYSKIKESRARLESGPVGRGPPHRDTHGVW